MHEEETGKSGGAAAPEGDEHPAPSMLWFVIPMALIVVYALLSR